MSSTVELQPDPRLRWLFQPLPPSRFFAVSGALFGLGIGYCTLHEAVRREAVDLWVSASWAVGAVVPFFLAFEVAKRIPSRARLWPRVLLSVAAANGLSLLTETVLVASPTPWSAELFSRVPISALLAGLLALGWILRDRPLRRAPRPSAPPLELPSPPSQVRYARSAGNYVELYGPEETHLIRTTLGALEQRWSGHGFVRIHRSTLVSRAWIAAFETEQGVGWVRLTTGERLRVSRAYRHRLG